MTLYVSDLDGTLLTREPALSAVSRAALTELLRDGLAFSVASARSVTSMRPLLRGLPLTLPVVEFNGAFLSDLSTGRHEVVNAFPSPLPGELCALIGAFGCVPFVSTFDGRDDCLYSGPPINDGMRYYLEERRAHRDPRLRACASLAAPLREQVVCLTAIERRERLVELEAAVNDRYPGLVATCLMENQYSPGWFWLTLHDRRATKAQGVRALRTRYGLADRELVVFGDHVNDVSLFREADHAVAVANALPEVKLHAARVIGSHEEDSVVHYIREHRDRGRSP